MRLRISISANRAYLRVEASMEVFFGRPDNVRESCRAPNLLSSLNNSLYTIPLQPGRPRLQWLAQETGR